MSTERTRFRCAPLNALERAVYPMRRTSLQSRCAQCSLPRCLSPYLLLLRAPRECQIPTYLFAAASALAASTVSRSIFATIFPVRAYSTPFLTPLYPSTLQLFARQMFESLNPQWVSTVLGIVAAVVIPIPIVLQRYGFLFVLEVQVCTNCATHQTPKFCHISLAVALKHDCPPDCSRTRW